MGKVLMSSEAENDLVEILGYIADDNPAAAFALEQRLLAVFELLSENRLAGRLRPEFQEGTRSFAVGSYLVLYRIWSGDVAIVRILHGSRDIETLMGPE